MTAISVLPQLKAIIRATRILSASEFRFANHAFTAKPIGDETPEAALIRTLRDVLYGQTYCRAFRGAYQPFAESSAVDPALAQALSNANTSHAGLDENWHVESVQPNGQVAARKGNIARTFWPGEFLLAPGQFGPPARGSMMSVQWPAETTSAQPGFYIAFGQAIPDAQDEQSIIRFYWNVRASGIAVLMAQLTQHLNAHQIPFQFKCPLHPRNYARRDTAVLYVCGRHAQVALWVIQSVHAALKPHLRADVPLFTQPIATGLAWAQDPSTTPDPSESFGQHRTRLLAEGLWHAHQQGLKTLRQRLRCITQQFAVHNVALDKPHVLDSKTISVNVLSPRFETAGRLEIVPEKPLANRLPARTAHKHIDGQSDFLEAATRIGAQLCRDAWWWDEQCNWMSDSYEYTNGAWRVVHRSVGPEVYAGSSGIAQFLTQLYAHTGDMAHRYTAEGAMRHALAHLDDIAPNHVISYYTGWLGIAYATHTLGQCLDQPAWEIQAREVVSALQAKLTTGLDRQELDVIGGCASAIPALLQLHHAWRDESLLDAAVQCGEHLLAVARKSKHGLAWATVGDATRGYELCGYAHGAAGIALALLELHAATGEAHYKYAAYEGFRYERHWFSPAHHNWPDLRDAQPHISRSALPYDMVAWCHGAAGIGLSRLRAYELTQDNLFLEEATQAAQATLRWLQLPGVLTRESFCRCHGVAGNASFLLAAGNALKQPMWVDAVLEAGRAGLREYANRRLPWPCGVETTRAEVPGYMLGLAGIGAFYLELHLNA